VLGVMPLQISKMSIDQLDKIDIISTTPQGEVVLHVADHLEWENEKEHILLLQDKINAYLQYIESGQVLDDYPNAKNNKVAIEVVFKHAPPGSILTYLEQFKKVVENLGVLFLWHFHNTEV
jgi:hypothetical protein